MIFRRRQPSSVQPDEHAAYASIVLRAARAEVAIKLVRRRCQEGRDGPYAMYTNVVKDDILDILNEALGEPEQMPAQQPDKCQRCRGLGKVPDWSNWDDYHGEPKPKPCPDCTPQDRP